MKKNVAILLFAASLSFDAASQDLEQRAKARAEAAAQQCINELNYPNGWEMVSYASLNQVCDYRFGGNPNIFGYVVHVAVRPRCVPNQYCIQVIQPLATVTVSCSGEVTDVTCGISEF